MYNSVSGKINGVKFQEFIEEFVNRYERDQILVALIFSLLNLDPNKRKSPKIILMETQD